MMNFEMIWRGCLLRKYIKQIYYLCKGNFRDEKAQSPDIDLLRNVGGASDCDSQIFLHERISEEESHYRIVGITATKDQKNS